MKRRSYLLFGLITALGSIALSYGVIAKNSFAFVILTFPVDYLYALITVLITTGILFPIAKYLLKLNVNFSESYIAGYIVMAIILSIYNISVLVRNHVENKQINQTIKAQDTLEATFADIMKTQTIDRCDELAQLNGSQVQFEEFAFLGDKYALYTPENCKKILQGDYAYFSDQGRIQKNNAYLDPFGLVFQESGWLAIFNTFGYSHCMQQTGLKLYQYESEGVPIQTFCNVKQALAKKDIQYCLKIDASNKEYNEPEALLSRNGCIGAVARISGKSELCDQTSTPFDSVAKPWPPEGEEYRQTLITRCKDDRDFPSNRYLFTPDMYSWGDRYNWDGIKPVPQP